MLENEQLAPHSQVSIITPSQLRAARGMLDWSRDTLAKKASVSAETIKNIEHGAYSPKKETIAALVEAFVKHGIQFVHYETVIAVSAGSKPNGDTITLTHSGVIQVAASAPTIMEADHV